MKKKTVISVSVSPKVLAAIDEVAVARGVSRSALVNRLLEDGVVEERKSLRVLENPMFQAMGLVVAKLPGVLEFMSRLSGGELSDEEVAEMRAVIEDQIERGRDRRTDRLRPDVGLGTEGS